MMFGRRFAGVKQFAGWTRTLSASSSVPRSFDYDVNALYYSNPLRVPALPLPSVEDTVKRYLETVRPVARSEEEFRPTKALAEEFLHGNDSKTLQKALKEMVDAPGYPFSYIEKYWDDMYLGGRFEIMVGSNPFYAFHDESSPALERAAALSSALLRFWAKILRGKLDPDYEKDSPLCHYGYGLIFGGTRVPAIGRDRFYQTSDRNSVIVICNHQYFKVRVMDHLGRVISPEALKKALQEIERTALSNKEAKVENDPGVLTGCERDFWASTRNEFLVSPVNAEAIKAMDHSLFIIALDQHEVSTKEERSNLFLHGKNGTNRWFDKHQVIVTKDGKLGMNFDHTFGDGLNWNRMLAESIAEVEGRESGYTPLPAPALASELQATYEPIEWDLSTLKRQEALAKARDDALKLASDVDTHVLDFETYGRNRIKEMKISPDAACQMAFQIAYADLHGKKATVYESCAMRHVYHGRTETIRSFTSESSAMINAFLNGESDEMKLCKLREAARIHVEVAKGAKAASGPFQGVDRHMHALKSMAAEKKIEVPFFEDNLYGRSSTWILSTSNVSAPFIEHFGFGAVTGDGYGLGYMTPANSIPVNITSYKSSPETNSKALGKKIESTLNEFARLTS